MKQGEEKLNGKLVVLFIVVIACSLAIQAGLALEKTALNPDYYRSLLGDPGLQQSIYSRLWQGITGQEKLPGDDSAVYQAFCRSFDEQWLSKQLDQAITGALHFIKGAEQQLTITLDIAEQKEPSAGSCSAWSASRRLPPWPLRWRRFYAKISSPTAIS